MKTIDPKNLKRIEGHNITLPPNTIRKILYNRRRISYNIGFFDYKGEHVYAFKKNNKGYLAFHAAMEPGTTIDQLKALDLFTIIKTLDTNNGKPYEYMARGDVPKGLTVEMLELLGTNIYEGQVSAPQPQKGYHNTNRALDRELAGTGLEMGSVPLSGSEGTANIHERSRVLFKKGGII